MASSPTINNTAAISHEINEPIRSPDSYDSTSSDVANNFAPIYPDKERYDGTDESLNLSDSKSARALPSITSDSSQNNYNARDTEKLRDGGATDSFEVENTTGAVVNRSRIEPCEQQLQRLSLKSSLFNNRADVIIEKRHFCCAYKLNDFSFSPSQDPNGDISPEKGDLDKNDKCENSVIFVKKITVDNEDDKIHLIYLFTKPFSFSCSDPDADDPIITSVADDNNKDAKLPSFSSQDPTMYWMETDDVIRYNTHSYTERDDSLFPYSAGELIDERVTRLLRMIVSRNAHGEAEESSRFSFIPRVMFLPKDNSKAENDAIRERQEDILLSPRPDKYKMDRIGEDNEAYFTNFYRNSFAEKKNEDKPVFSTKFSSKLRKMFIPTEYSTTEENDIRWQNTGPIPFAFGTSIRKMSLHNSSSDTVPTGGNEDMKPLSKDSQD